MLKIRSGGFVLVEFAIALPLLILVLYALAMVSLNIFRLGRAQLADYVLESEAQYAMQRITDVARRAREVDLNNHTNKFKFVYRSVDSTPYTEYMPSSMNPQYLLYIDRDVWETRYFIPYKKKGGNYINLYAERQENIYTNPITGENYFGDTQLISLKFSKLNENVLRIELEMESLVTKHKIKIATAVFVPGLDKSMVISNE